MTHEPDWFLDVVCVVLLVLCGSLLVGKLRQRRPEAFIRSYVFPPSVISEFAKHHPNIDASGRDKVAEGLRQFFLVRLRAGVRLIGMPSRVVDDLWHEFILDTREYERFCKSAFGRFFHHVPAAANPPGNKADASLRRTWRHACAIESVYSTAPLKLPLLFAIDTELQIPDGHSFINWLSRPPRQHDGGGACGGSGGGGGGHGCAGGGGCSGSCGGGCGGH